MEDLFQQFWWLIFPIFGMGMGAYSMWSHERRRRDAIDLLKLYAQKGEEPPPAILKAVSSPNPESWGVDMGDAGDIAARRRKSYSDWYNVVLFLSLGAAFLFAARYGPEGAEWAFVMVAIIMGGLTIGSLVVAVLKRRDAGR